MTTRLWNGDCLSTFYGLNFPQLMDGTNATIWLRVTHSLRFATIFIHCGSLVIYWGKSIIFQTFHSSRSATNYFRLKWFLWRTIFHHFFIVLFGLGFSVVEIDISCMIEGDMRLGFHFAFKVIILFLFLHVYVFWMKIYFENYNFNVFGES